MLYQGTEGAPFPLWLSTSTRMRSPLPKIENLRSDLKSNVTLRSQLMMSTSPFTRDAGKLVCGQVVWNSPSAQRMSRMSVAKRLTRLGVQCSCTRLSASPFLSCAMLGEVLLSMAKMQEFCTELFSGVLAPDTTSAESERREMARDVRYVILCYVKLTGLVLEKEYIRLCSIRIHKMSCISVST